MGPWDFTGFICSTKAVGRRFLSGGTTHRLSDAKDTFFSYGDGDPKPGTIKKGYFGENGDIYIEMKYIIQGDKVTSHDCSVAYGDIMNELEKWPEEDQDCVEVTVLHWDDHTPKFTLSWIPQVPVKKIWLKQGEQNVVLNGAAYPSRTLSTDDVKTAMTKIINQILNEGTTEELPNKYYVKAVAGEVSISIWRSSMSPQLSFEELADLLKVILADLPVSKFGGSSPIYGRIGAGGGVEHGYDYGTFTLDLADVIIDKRYLPSEDDLDQRRTGYSALNGTTITPVARV